MNTELFECLLEIQQTLKVEKLNNNDFGGYKYRSLPDIVLKAKPIANKHNCVIMTKDTLVHEGDRYYVCAEAIILHKSGESISTTSLARETQSRPKMDDAQITGSASSYARKYAYNGLFAIDDSKDTDALNNSLAYTQPHTEKSMEQKSADVVLLNDALKRASQITTLEELSSLYYDPKYAAIKDDRTWLTALGNFKSKLKK